MDGRKLLVVVAGALLLLGALAAQAQEEPKEPKEPQYSGKEIRALIKKLAEENEQERAKLIQKLLKIGTPAVSELNKLFGVGVEEKPAIPQSELDATIKRLVENLDSAEWMIREKASKALVEIGEPAVAALKKALEESSSEEVKERAQKALEKIKHDLTEGMPTEIEYEWLKLRRKYSAVGALGSIEGKESEKGLLGALAEKDPAIALAALYWLRARAKGSLGFTASDLANKTDEVVAKWREFLENPAQAKAVCELKSKAPAAGSETCVTADYELTNSILSKENQGGGGVIIMGGGQQQEDKGPKARSAKITAQQKWTDKVLNAGEAVLEFERAYEDYRQTFSSEWRGSSRKGVAETYKGKKLGIRRKNGAYDIVPKQGELSLARKEQLAASLGALDALLPGKEVAPGEYWELSDMVLGRLLRSFVPAFKPGEFIKSASLKACLSGVAEVEGRKLARISILGRFSTTIEAESDWEDAGRGPAAGMGMIIRRVGMFSSGNTPDASFGNTLLLGDCYFDLETGSIVAAHVCGSVYKCDKPKEDRRNAFGRGQGTRQFKGFFSFNRKDVVAAPEPEDK